MVLKNAARVNLDGRPDDSRADYVPLATLDSLEEPTGSRNIFMGKTAEQSQSGWIVRFARRSKELFDSNTGLLLISLSQGFASLMGVFVKKLNELDPPVHPLELIWVRMVMTWIVCVVYMSMTGVPDPILGPKGIRTLLAFRGLAGFMGLFGTYYALQYLSLSDTTVLSFLTPMATAIAGALLLKEDLTIKQVLASILSFAGVVLIARPEFLFGRDAHEGTDSAARVVTAAQRLGAVGVALLGVVGLTSAYTTIRAIGQRAHPMHNLGAFSLFCILFAPIGMVVARTPVVIPDNLPCLLMILAVSSCGFAAQMTMTTGLQRETAGRGTMAIYVQVIFALVFERIFFHTTPPPLSILGTVIILSSAIYVALSKQAASKRPKRSAEDTALEEGLLASAREGDERANAHEMDNLDDKLLVVNASKSSKASEKYSTGSTESLNHEPEPGSSKSASCMEEM
ncbi:EamA-like transporter family-domain-containing protein [Cerioporus squamosus]|nr:EamA-like transporter family-domain-containing protein [Cerioporus squamosus]